MAQVKGPRDMFWQLCVGADHPGILLRPANLEQLRLAHREIGFKYIRFHGIFHDDMNAYREVNGAPVYDFTKIDAVYDAILQTGMKPFVELGFMPHDLASHDKTIFYWKGQRFAAERLRQMGGFHHRLHPQYRTALRQAGSRKLEIRSLERAEPRRVLDRRRSESLLQAL